MEEKVNDKVPPAVNPAKSTVFPADPRDLIVRYIKYLPLVVLCVIAFLIIAYIKIRYSTPIYHVQALLLINNEEVTGNSKDPRFQEMFMMQGSANIGNEIQILKSSSIMSRVSKDLKLDIQYFDVGKIRTTQVYPNPPFTLQFLDPIDSLATFSIQVTVLNDNEFNIINDKGTYYFGREFVYNGRRIMLTRDKRITLEQFSTPVFLVERMPDIQVAGDLLQRLKITGPSDETTILLLSYDGENATLGSDVLKTLMNVHDSLIIEDKNRISTNTLNFIDKQLEALKGQLGNVEVQTRSYMISNDVFDITDQSKLYGVNLEEIAKKNGEIQVKVSVLEMLSNYMSNSKANGTVPVPALLGIEEPALAQSVSEYNKLQLQREANLKTTTPDNPLIQQMNAALEKLRNDILQVLKNVKQSYLIASSRLQKADEDYQSRLKSMPGKSMQLLNIQRRQKVLEDLYSFLLMKKLETSVSAAAIVSNSRVVEPPAGSSVPISPDRKNIYMFNLLLGLLLPTVFIFLREFLRDKVYDRSDIERHLQVPILGEISHSEDSQALVVTQNSRRFIAEQFRTVRSNLKYLIAKYDRPTIMVTSSFSGEGKSFISTNIGAVMALTGKKTVIMEFDIRKPKIISGLELKRKSGITNYIIGKAQFEDIILPVQEVENLYVIPCGPIPPNPAELLLDDRMEQLMQKVKANFEVVIMDTAPVGLVADAYNLAKYANCTLFIVRQGYTYRKQLNAIEEFFIEKKLPSISILLNDVKIQNGYYSGYGHYGGYGYYSNSFKSHSGYFENEIPVKRGGILSRFLPRRKK